VHSSADPRQGFRYFGAALLLGTLMIASGCRKPNAAAGPGIRPPLNEFGKDSANTADYLYTLTFVITSDGDSVFYGNVLCGDPTKCPAGGLRMMFIPEQDAQNVDWKLKTQPHHSGDVVAIMLNVDSVEFPDLELKPGHFAYAWVGQSGPANTDRGFAIYTLNRKTGLKARTWWLTSASDIRYCDYQQTRGKPAIKGENPHGNCPTPATSQSNGGSSHLASTDGSLHLVAANPARGLWVSCSSGCCEVNGGTFMASTEAPMYRARTFASLRRDGSARP
jgi:hypothetical protein